MCPYPAQVDRQTIIDKAGELIEAEGFDQLSLARLGAALGIKAPSLYKYVASKAELLKAVNTVTISQLVAAMQHAAESDSDPTSRLMAVARTYRDFAHAHPVTYNLAYSATIPEARPDPRQLEQMALPLQALIEPISGQAESLAALRGAWALIHGFVTLELNDQFQRGGDVEAAFFQAVEVYIAGWREHNLANRTPDQHKPK